MHPSLSLSFSKDAGYKEEGRSSDNNWCSSCERGLTGKTNKTKKLMRFFGGLISNKKQYPIINHCHIITTISIYYLRPTKEIQT